MAPGDGGEASDGDNGGGGGPWCRKRRWSCQLTLAMATVTGVRGAGLVNGGKDGTGGDGANGGSIFL